MDLLPECTAKLNTSIQLVLSREVMGDAECVISIYWKDQEMEEKVTDWKMLEWWFVSQWIDLSPTAL